QVADDLGVGIGGVVLQQGVIADVHTVSAVAAQSLGVGLVDLVAQQHAAQLHAQIVGQLAALAEQLVAGAQDDAVALLAEYPHALEGGGVFTIESHNSVLLPLNDVLLAQNGHQLLAGGLVGTFQHGASALDEIGRASCRERGESAGGAGVGDKTRKHTD